MTPSPIRWAAAAAAAWLPLSAQDDPARPPTGAPGRGELEHYCAECHTGDDAARGFDVLALDAAAPTERGELATAAWQRVRSGTMPPADADAQPGLADRRHLALTLAAMVPDVPGSRVATVRRLTRSQYGHAVQDLFGVPLAAAERLPEDARAHGFDTNGDLHGVTPLLFETYLLVATEVAAAVMASPTARAGAFPVAVPLADALPALLERAFRRPALPEEVADRLALVAAARARGDDEQQALAALLQSILVSPAFLLRAERGRDGDPRALDAYELAGRLAFFLMVSTPDEALLAHARSGDLQRPEVLVAESRRLLAKDGGRRFTDDFAAQWLRFRDVLGANADSRRYPQIWDGALRPALYEQAAQLFLALLADDAPVTQLLDADFTFANRTLAALYGLPAVDGDGFVRVPLQDRRRGGILGAGAVLMVSSYPLRTSPVLRGRFVLETLLDAGTPPPPPDAGRLPADDEPVHGATLRAQLERHRRDPRCASCHAVLDPPGFALENFDVLGRWRDELHGTPIDARGTLPGGVELDGPVALRHVLLRRKDDFVRAFASKLLTYAIGRPMLPADEPELARIVAATAAGGDRFSALLAAVVTSPLFMLRDPGAS